MEKKNEFLLIFSVDVVHDIDCLYIHLTEQYRTEKCKSLWRSALRTMEIDVIITMGLFLHDLHEHIV
jgi:hypothetical protein